MKYSFNARKKSPRPVKRLLDSKRCFTGTSGEGSVADFGTTRPVWESVSDKASKIEAASKEMNTSSHFESRLTY